MRVPYGKGWLSIDFEEGRLVEAVSPKAVVPDPGAISTSLSSPIDFIDFESFVSNKQRILVVVNDHTRSTPTAEVLKHLDLKSKDVTTLIASGSHRPPNAKETQRILGSEKPPYGGRVLIHDCRNENSLKPLGKTSRGTKLSFNSLLFDADAIIPITSVEPHYFAGFTGGRKFLLPALAGFDSIVMNHSLAAEDSSRILALAGNPVHEDFMEALEMFGRLDDIFSIQLVLNNRSEVSYASSGEIVKSFEDAVVHAKEIYVPKVQNKADIVVSVNQPPLDIDLYQSQKALQNVEYAVKNGGIIILVSTCREGIGDQHFYKLLTTEKEGLSKENAHKFGYHKIVKLTKLLKHTSVFAVTDLPPNVPQAIGLTSYQNLQEALASATRIKGENSHLLVVLDAGITVPTCAS